MYAGTYVLENGFQVCGVWNDDEPMVYHNLVQLPEKPIEIGVVGMGFTLVHREVFEAIGEGAFWPVNEERSTGEDLLLLACPRGGLHPHPRARMQSGAPQDDGRVSARRDPQLHRGGHQSRPAGRGAQRAQPRHDGGGEKLNGCIRSRSTRPVDDVGHVHRGVPDIDGSETGVLRTIHAQSSAAAHSITVTTGGADAAATRLFDAYALTALVPAIFNGWWVVPATAASWLGYKSDTATGSIVMLTIGGYVYT